MLAEEGRLDHQPLTMSSHYATSYLTQNKYAVPSCGPSKSCVDMNALTGFQQEAAHLAKSQRMP